MNIMPIIILLAIAFFGYNGKNRGVVNYKFTVERTALTLGLMPNLAIFAKTKLSQFMPETLAAIIGIVLGIAIVFSILTYILGKITKIPEYEYTGADKTLGFFAGMLKGFCIFALLILIYGVFYIDAVAPEVVTKNMKNNFVNGRMNESIDYYRTTVYSLYVKSSGASVEDLYASKKELLTETKVVNYIPWTEGYEYVPPKPEVEEPKEDKKKSELPNMEDFK